MGMQDSAYDYIEPWNRTNLPGRYSYRLGDVAIHRVLLLKFVGQLLRSLRIGVVVDEHVGTFCCKLLAYQGA